MPVSPRPNLLKHLMFHDAMGKHETKAIDCTILVHRMNYWPAFFSN